MVRRAVLLALVAAVRLAAQNAAACEKALDRWDFAEAEKLGEALTKSRPNSAPAHVLLARAYLGKNDAKAAMAELARATKLEPDNLDALYYLAKLSGILSQQQFVQLLQMAPDSARAHQVKAEALAAQNEPEKAEAEYAAALEKKPDAVSVMAALGDLRRLQGECGDGLAWYQKALAKAPEYYDALYGAGACHFRQKEPEQAVSYFRRALAADPESLAAKLALGQMLLETQQADRALPLLEAAAKADPNLKRVFYMLGRAYTLAGRKEDAQRAFERFRAITEPSASEATLVLEEAK